MADIELINLNNQEIINHSTDEMREVIVGSDPIVGKIGTNPATISYTELHPDINCWLSVKNSQMGVSVIDGTLRHIKFIHGSVLSIVKSKYRCFNRTLNQWGAWQDGTTQKVYATELSKKVNSLCLINSLMPDFFDNELGTSVQVKVQLCDANLAMLTIPTLTGTANTSTKIGINNGKAKAVMLSVNSDTYNQFADQFYFCVGHIVTIGSYKLPLLGTYRDPSNNMYLILSTIDDIKGYVGGDALDFTTTSFKIDPDWLVCIDSDNVINIADIFINNDVITCKPLEAEQPTILGSIAVYDSNNKALYDEPEMDYSNQTIISNPVYIDVTVQALNTWVFFNLEDVTVPNTYLTANGGSMNTFGYNHVIFQGMPINVKPYYYVVNDTDANTLNYPDQPYPFLNVIGSPTQKGQWYRSSELHSISLSVTKVDQKAYGIGGYVGSYMDTEHTQLTIANSNEVCVPVHIINGYCKTIGLNFNLTDFPLGKKFFIAVGLSVDNVSKLESKVMKNISELT